jgi:hypothetical protein
MLKNEIAKKKERKKYCSNEDYFVTHRKETEINYELQSLISLMLKNEIEIKNKN